MRAWEDSHSSGKARNWGWEERNPGEGLYKMCWGGDAFILLIALILLAHASALGLLPEEELSRHKVMLKEQRKELWTKPSQSGRSLSAQFLFISTLSLNT